MATQASDSWSVVDENNGYMRTWLALADKSGVEVKRIIRDEPGFNVTVFLDHRTMMSLCDWYLRTQGYEIAH